MASHLHKVSLSKKPAKHKRLREPTLTSTTTTSNQRHHTKPPTSSHFGTCHNVRERYEKIGRVGEGTYGIVYKARDKQTNQLVALKRCFPHQEAAEGFSLTTLREINALRNCQHHPNIIRLLTVAVSTSSVFLVFDYCPYDLAQLVDQHYQLHCKSPFSLPQVKRLMVQLFSALQFIHARHILHRDLKLANLLYDENGALKLADFGLSRKYKPPMTPKVASLWYRPPELMLSTTTTTTTTQYDESIDIWGAGCIMGELLLGTPLWKNCKTEMEMMDAFFRELGTPPIAIQQQQLFHPSIPAVVTTTKPSPAILWDRFPEMSVAGVLLLSHLLHWDPKRRWSAQAALEALYFHEFPLPTTPATAMPKF